MSHSHFEMPPAIYAAYEEASKQSYYPRGTVRCSGVPLFRSQLARDLGCLLDVDPNVVAWLCLPAEIKTDGGVHVPDFLVDYEDGSRTFIDASDQEGARDVTDAAAIAGFRHRFIPRNQIEAGFRLQNARDLLRYANCRTPLNDRIRLLAVLDEAGSLSIADCLHVFREVPPMTAISWMVLNRTLMVDLDDAMIGPETLVRRFTR
ncbi:MAG: hypothetical protein WCE42_23910 [Rhizobium ruizarguesonis]